MKWILDVVLGCAICVVFFCALALIVHLVVGSDTSPRGVLVAGLRFFGAALTVALIVVGVGRWVYWFADRRVRKS